MSVAAATASSSPGTPPSPESGSQEETAAAATAAGAAEAVVEPSAAFQGTARVDTGTAVEAVTVELLSPGNSLVNVTLGFPLGMVLEATSEGISVAEVTPGGNAQTAQVRVGDLVRATTAATMQMTYPPVNLLFGGVGRPRLVRVLLSTKGMTFSKCAGAIRSNLELTADGRSNAAVNEDSFRPASSNAASVTLVLERRGAVEAAAQLPWEKGDGTGKSVGGSGVFDPRIFE